jgi:hypothetical protein
MEGMNKTRVQYVYIWKCQNESLIKLSYTNKSVFKK